MRVLTGVGRCLFAAIAVLGCSSCMLHDDSTQGSDPEGSLQPEPSSGEVPGPKPPKLSKDDKKKTRVRYTWGGTSSPCGPRYVLTVFEDGVVHCEGEDHLLSEDCPPAWGGVESMSTARAQAWIDLVREQLSGKKLGVNDCEGAWSHFTLYSRGKVEAETENLRCVDEGPAEQRLTSSGGEIWRAFCRQFAPPASDEDEETKKTSRP